MVVLALYALLFAGAERCESLARVKSPGATILSASLEAAGTFTPPGWRDKADTPSFCRVVARVAPSIQFEVWLPQSGWNGRFLGVGNGGFGGYINYDDLVRGVKDGYATASTDTGHVGFGAAPGQDGKWALRQPQLIADHAYRAIHEMTVRAKAVATAFYGEPVRSSIFFGCSTGGRQGLAEAQRYPADYNGVVAISPVNFYTHLYGSMMWIRHATKEPASALPDDKLALLTEASLGACDASDGVRDGIIDDPRDCKFDPASLRCATGATDRCLTDSQVESARKIYSPVRNPRTRAEIFPGLMPGSEWGWNFLAGPNAFRVPVEFMKYFVYNDSDWDWRSFDLDKDVSLLDSRFGKDFNAIEPTLKGFRARGGKLIIVHGWNDAAVSPLNSINYYESARKAIGGAAAKGYVRLFMAPGVSHCGGGAGPSQFDPAAVIREWVDTERPPDRIVVAKRSGGAVTRTRPLCAYPQVARYTGSGSTDDAANFVCREK